MMEEPAHYRWTSYRFDALGQADARLAPHQLYRALGQDDKSWQAYATLFRAQLDRDPATDFCLALNQSQPLGNERFYAKIEKMTGVRGGQAAAGRGWKKSKSSQRRASLRCRESVKSLAPFTSFYFSF